MAHSSTDGNASTSNIDQDVSEQSDNSISPSSTTLCDSESQSGSDHGLDANNGEHQSYDLAGVGSWAQGSSRKAAHDQSHEGMNFTPGLISYANLIACPPPEADEHPSQDVALEQNGAQDCSDDNGDHADGSLEGGLPRDSHQANGATPARSEGAEDAQAKE